MGIYSLPGLNISLRGPESRIRSAIEVMFGLLPKPSSQKTIPLTAYPILGTSEARDVLPGWLFEEMSELGPSDEVVMFYGRTGEIAAVAVGEDAIYCTWLSATADELGYVACKKTRKRTPLSVSSVLMPVLREVLMAYGGALLHAAALLCPNDTGILIAADSGGGKTTTSLSLLRKGARILADDRVVSRIESEGVSIYGIPEVMNLTDQTISFFEELAGFSDRPRQKSISRKLMVYPHEVYGSDCIVERCRLKVIYFVEVTREGPFINPMATTDALGKLIRAHTFARRQRMTHDSVLQLCGLLSQVRAYSLGTGPDPEALGEWLMTKCNEHALD